jgi:hypothetical protein
MRSRTVALQRLVEGGGGLSLVPLWQNIYKSTTQHGTCCNTPHTTDTTTTQAGERAAVTGVRAARMLAWETRASVTRVQRSEPCHRQLER